MRHTMGGIQLRVPPRDSYYRLTLAIWENGGSFSCLIVAYDEAEKKGKNCQSEWVNLVEKTHFKTMFILNTLFFRHNRQKIFKFE